MNTLQEKLERLSKRMAIQGEPWDGNWAAKEMFLPATAELYTDDGIQILYPNMGMINRNTIYNDVSGFKRSTEQFKGLLNKKEIQSDPKKVEQIENNLQKLVVIASLFMQTTPQYQSKFDEGTTLYYRDGFIYLPDVHGSNEKIECQMLITIKDDIDDDGKQFKNIAFKIEERKVLNSLPPAPDMDDLAKELMKSIRG
jgi:hypothetical protein